MGERSGSVVTVVKFRSSWEREASVVGIWSGSRSVGKCILCWGRLWRNMGRFPSKLKMIIVTSRIALDVVHKLILSWVGGKLSPKWRGGSKHRSASERGVMC